MRKDMAKVIVERPRYVGSEKRGGRAAARDRLDPESAPLRAPLRDRDARTKSLNENLAPLRRYLFKQVGRPWDKVRSEIAEHVRKTSAVQNHIYEHLASYVKEHVVLIGGVPYTTYGGRPSPIVSAYDRYWPQHSMYVCPQSGLLKVAKRPIKPQPKAALEIRRMGVHERAVRWGNGGWYGVEFEAIDSLSDHDRYRITDAALGYYVDPVQLAKTWGCAPNGRTRYATRLRALSKAEVRRLY